MSRRTQKNVGVIGLGIIGRRVADNLRRRGFQVFVWNRTPRPFPNFVGSPSEVAELCDFIQVFVSDDDALLEMVRQMKQSLGPNHVVMAHSTVAPHTMRAAAEVVQRRGAEFLDAPFTGSKIPAEKGELVYYVAGDDAAYRRARPILEASSKEIIEIGEIGQATTVKIATNMVTAATVQAAAEALALVHNSGLEPETFVAALRGNASNSATLTMKLPKMIEWDFDAHFSVKHMLKDVQIAARLARSYGITFGATEAARDSLREEADRGRADQDFSSLLHFFFPDGPPWKATDEEAEAEEQPTLSGLDEERDGREPAPERAATDVEDTQVQDAHTPARRDEPEERAEPVVASDEPVQNDRPEPEVAARDAAAEPAADRPETQEVAAVSEQNDAVTSEREVEAEQEEAASESPPEAAETEERESAAAVDEQPIEAASEVPHEADAGSIEHAAPGDGEERTGEPPLERPVNGAAAEAAPRPPDKEAEARRSFLSRMFGKGTDY